MNKQSIRPIDAFDLVRKLSDIGGCGARPGSWEDGWDNAIEEAICLVQDACEINSAVKERFCPDCGEWISVEDRLPDSNESVLYWSSILGDLGITCKADFYSNCVTHWMPLTEPPKE